MTRYLVVANLTLVSDALFELLQERVKSGPCEIYVVAPAARDVATWKSHDDDEGYQAARARLERAMERFRSLGVDVDGEVGDASPVQAIGDVLRRGDYDEVILSTLPPGPSRWLGMDLPRRIQRAWNVPLTHVVAR